MTIYSKAAIDAAVFVTVVMALVTAAALVMCIFTDPETLSRGFAVGATVAGLVSTAFNVGRVTYMTRSSR